MSPHRTTRAYLCAIFSAVSCWRAFIAAGDSAERCGPRRNAATICCLDQFGPASTGQPSMAQACNMGAVEWPNANERGNINLPILSLMGACAGMDSSVASVVAMWASISGSVMATRGDLNISMWMEAGVRLVVIFDLPHVEVPCGVGTVA